MMRHTVALYEPQVSRSGSTGTVFKSADYLNVSVAKTNGNIVLSVAHKAKPVHDVSAMQVTVVVEQLDANMQTGATILESFDVFMHTLNAPFLRVTQVLGAAAGNDPAANALQYSLWDGSANYNAAKTSYATMEFEAGDGAYTAAMASDCLFLNQTDGNYGEFVLSDPAQRSRLLRNTDGTVATLDRDIAKSIRRLAIDEAATSLTIQVGNAQVAVATKSAAEVGRMGLQGGNSINANGITSTNNYHLLTFAAPHGLEVGDIALLKDNNNIQKLPVIYKENTKIGVYSTTAPAANATLYTDLCVLRIKFTASPGARKDRLGLSACVLNGTNLDARMFHDRSRISLITNGAAFTMRANDAAWRKGTNSRHAERVFMLDWQADDLHAIATVTTGAATHTVEMANQFVVGDLVQLAKTGQTSVEARISAAMLLLLRWIFRRISSQEVSQYLSRAWRIRFRHDLWTCVLRQSRQPVLPHISRKSTHQIRVSSCARSCSN